EPNIYPRTNEPVNVYLEFEPSTHRYNTTRVVKYIEATQQWEEIPFQLSNVTNQTGDIYILSCNVHFLATVSQNSSVDYYMYYSEDSSIQPPQYSTDLQTEYNINSLNVSNGHYSVGMATNKGVYNLTLSGVNYHQDNSLMPMSRVIPTSGAKYSPDAQGFIRDMIIAGPFDEPTDWNSYVALSSQYHLDITRNWVSGDHCTGGNASSTYLDESKTWYENHDADSLIDFNTLWSNPEYAAGYAMFYVYTETDLNGIYLKLSSDDGIGVVMDNNLLYYHHVLRAVGSSDEEAYGIDLSAGWHSFLIFVEERTGGFSFRIRFSTDDTLRSVSDGTNSITNLTIALNPQTQISSITPIEQGPVYCQYDLTWTDISDMKVWDRITFFGGSTSMYKIERTFWWRNYHTSPDNSSFAVVNTFYKPDFFDEYLYDNQRLYGISNDEFKSHNYTMVRDFNGDNRLTTLGIFLTNIERGNQFITLSDINWTTYYTSGSSGSINMIPGNETDLNKPGTFGAYPDHSDYNVTITFWEYIDENIGAVNQYQGALSIINGLYNSLKNPLQISVGNVENLFFNLRVHLSDVDGLSAKGVNVTIINATDFSGWDFTSPPPKTQLTDDNGNTTFIRLKEANYTLNITYEKYGRPVMLLRMVNVTVNTTKDITISHINLTHLDLNLVDSNTIEPIVGANVSFYYNNGTSTEYIGSEISDSSGYVSFYWLNKSKSVMNYTFSVNFLGAIRNINITDTTPTQNVTTPLENYTTYTVSVVLEAFETYLNVETGTIINNNTWGDIIRVNVSYWYVYGATDNGTIPQATVSYSLQGLYGEIASGYLTPNGTAGYYNVSLDTGALGMEAAMPYSLYIYASKPSYTPASNYTSITLKKINLDIVPETNSIEVYWLENITLSVYLNDTYNNKPIDGATINYDAASVSGVMTPDTAKGSGWYNLTINSTEFIYAGSYTLKLEAQKINYDKAQEFISLTIWKIRTLINGTIFLPTSFSMYVTYSHNFYVNYTTADGTPISDADITYWEIQKLDQNGHVVWDTNGSLTETANPGIYMINGLNTSALSLGTYSIIIQISENNYVERVCAISLKVENIPTFINVSYLDKSINKTSNVLSITNTINITDGFNYTFSYIDVEGGLIGSADIIEYNWTRYDSIGGNVIESGSGTLIASAIGGKYILDFNMANRPVGYYEIHIIFNKNNYEERIATISLNIKLRDIAISALGDFGSNNNYRIEKIKGETFNVSIRLVDLSRGGAPLTGAMVNLTLPNFDVIVLKETSEGSGVYYALVNMENVSAFIRPTTLTGELSIWKPNYNSQKIVVTIVVGMEEIFPGMPTFYFLVIVGFIAVFAGGLGGYKYIQYARIPTIVKQLRATKKSILKNNKFSNTRGNLTYEEILVRESNPDYAIFGISLEDKILAPRARKGSGSKRDPDAELLDESDNENNENNENNEI
ncbi:MAG: hypothetical protein ACTSVC_08515, partial [Promethearchaeota archaeon]